MKLHQEKTINRINNIEQTSSSQFAQLNNAFQTMSSKFDKLLDMMIPTESTTSSSETSDGGKHQ